MAGLSAGTGSVFALLPPENANGDWIKIVQRLPVRVALDAAELVHHPLQLGLSMRITADTRDRGGPRLAPPRQGSPIEETTIYEVSLAEAERHIEAVIAANLWPEPPRP